MASISLPDPDPLRNLVATALAPASGTPSHAQLAGAIQEITVQTQIAGASLLVVTMIDPDLALQRSGMLTPTGEGLLPDIDLNFPVGSNSWWRLAMVTGGLDNSQPNLTLTFQDRIVAFLRDHWEPMTWPSGRVGGTRADFVAMLVAQVGRGKFAAFESPISFVCPSQHVLQPVASQLTNDLGQVTVSSAIDQANATAKQNKTPGVHPDSSATIANLKLDHEQIMNVNAALSLANQLHAGETATKALLEACMDESKFTNLSFGDRDSTGILQFRAGTAASLGINPMDVTACIHAFLTKNYYQGGVAGVTVNYGAPAGGAIQVARLNPLLSPSQVAQAVQGSGTLTGANYAAFAGEADVMYAAGGLAGGSLDAAQTVASDVAELTRGYAENPDETSWDCITRLAQQVGWFAFSNADTLYYMSGEDLIAQTPTLYLDYDKPADRARVLPAATWSVDNTAFAYRSTHKVKGRTQRKTKIARPQTPTEIQIPLLCGVWDVRAGETIVLRNFGVASGRWVIADATRNVLGDSFTQLTLEPPIAPYPEPQATAAAAASSPSSGSSPSASAASIDSAPSAKGGYTALTSAVYAGPDQGIDFTGPGPVYALADGVITRVQSSGSGWPGQGALLVYRMTSGIRSGQWVYVAEDFNPGSWTVGQQFKQGALLGHASGSNQAPGIEVGFAQNGQGEAFGTVRDGKPGGPTPTYGLAMAAFVIELSSSTPPVVTPAPRFNLTGNPFTQGGL